VDAGQIVGALLVLMGIAWMFIVYFVPRREPSRGGPRVAAGPWDAIVEVIKRLPVPFLPGALMIIVGALLVGFA
jgi:hypothetical protein